MNVAVSTSSRRELHRPGLQRRRLLRGYAALPRPRGETSLRANAEAHAETNAEAQAENENRAPTFRDVAHACLKWLEELRRAHNRCWQLPLRIMSFGLGRDNHLQFQLLAARKHDLCPCSSVRGVRAERSLPTDQSRSSQETDRPSIQPALLDGRAARANACRAGDAFQGLGAPASGSLAASRRQ